MEDKTDLRSEYFAKVIKSNNSIKRKQSLDETKPESIGTDYSYKHEVVWKNVLGYLILHSFGVWGLCLLVTRQVGFYTFLWGFVVLYLSAQGITIGAHRLFTHKSFKATPFLKGVLVILQTVAGQNSLLIWCRDHRLHHRYSDTDADPHNAKRGFFFSHIGWLMTKKHPHVIKLGKLIDMSDLKADWMVMYQKKYYYQLYFLFAIVLPVWVPVHFFAENLWTSLLVCYFFRYVIGLNVTWLVNSAAHLWGTRPYDQSLQPVESHFVSFLTIGEGWHNFHHTFPWDYKAAELSMHFNFNATLIRFFEKIGIAYDLKTVSPEMVERRIIRTGDGTHFILGNDAARASITAIGPLHPLNPSYTTMLEVSDTKLTSDGLPLYYE